MLSERILACHRTLLKSRPMIVDLTYELRWQRKAENFEDADTVRIYPKPIDNCKSVNTLKGITECQICGERGAPRLGQRRNNN